MPGNSRNATRPGRPNSPTPSSTYHEAVQQPKLLCQRADAEASFACRARSEVPEPPEDGESRSHSEFRRQGLVPFLAHLAKSKEPSSTYYEGWKKQVTQLL